MTEADIRTIVHRVAGELVRGVRIGDDTHVYDHLNMDSLDVIEFEVALEAALDRKIPNDFIGDDDTLGDIIKRLAEGVTS